MTKKRNLGRIVVRALLHSEALYRKELLRSEGVIPIGTEHLKMERFLKQQVDGETAQQLFQGLVACNNEQEEGEDQGTISLVDPVLNRSIKDVILDRARHVKEEDRDRAIDLGFAALQFLDQRVGALKRMHYEADSLAKTDGVEVHTYSFCLGHPQPSVKQCKDMEDEEGMQFGPIHRFSAYSYHIEIVNERDNDVQLMWRNWEIFDSDGRIEEVSGSGVVGAQPVIKPGDSFEYTSNAMIKSSAGVGTMKGTYELMDLETSRTFKVDIGEFGLIPDIDDPMDLMM